MAKLTPTLDNIKRLTVLPTEGEMYLLNYLIGNLDDSFEIFFNPFLDGDRPDIVILKKNVGVFIIEVKDWKVIPSNYQINLCNEWFFISKKGSHEIKSPFAQVFHYKNNFFEIHIPILGIKNVINENFYNVIDVFVYFHLADKTIVESFYDNNLRAFNELVKDSKNNTVNCPVDKIEYYRSKQKRDKNLSIFKENLDKKINKIKNKKTHKLFTDDIYKEFKRRLSPPDFILNQGKNIHLDQKQSKLIQSKQGCYKVKGVAGSGKTEVMISRAISSISRVDDIDSVLILTYNLSLKNYVRFRLYNQLRQKLKHKYTNLTRDLFEITNYHKFFISQANNHNIIIQPMMNNAVINEKLFKTNIFNNIETKKYSVIFLDEVQDYEPEWIKIIRDSFLAENGEMVLFGDQTQNIYARDVKSRESALVHGFGTWQKLNKSYRSCEKLIRIFSSYKETFLTNYQDEENYVVPQQNLELDLSHGEIIHFSNKNLSFSELCKYIREIIVDNNLIQNDTCILSSTISTLQGLEDEFSKFEKTTTSFETFKEIEEIKKELESRKFNDYQINEKLSLKKSKLRQLKKNFFSLNSGLVKFSTIHSFKGLELKNVFILINDLDDAEMVYTGITRSTNNLFVINIGNKKLFDNFFLSVLD